MKKVLFTLLLLFSIRSQAATLFLSNPGVAEFDHPERFTRVVAISDVHGMYKSLVRLLLGTKLIDPQLRWQGGHTLLVVVGDSIGKGSDSLPVLDLWMSLSLQARAAGGNIVHLLGDYEAEFLANPENPKTVSLLKELKDRHLPIQELTNVANPRAYFLRSMPLAARVGRWLFCHSGRYPSLMDWNVFRQTAKQILQMGSYGSPFITGPDSVLEDKKWWADTRGLDENERALDNIDFYGVVFGHQSKALGVENEIFAFNKARFIKIDSGMAPDEGAYPGHVLVFMDPVHLSKMEAPQIFSLSALGVFRTLN